VGFNPLTPARFLDTRSGRGLSGKQGAGDASVRSLVLAGTTADGTTVPSSARAIAANITVTNPDERRLRDGVEHGRVAPGLLERELRA
jgi:hypothetical protein